MKKILSTIACGAVLATTASADFARIEAGAGLLSPTPKGTLSYSDAGATGAYVSNEKPQSNYYAWMLVKHPLPIIPNLRLEYATLSDEGHAEGSFAGTTVTFPTATPSKVDLTQFDVIPYYNILDNTFWITVDVGLDVKVIHSDYKIDAVPSSGLLTYSKAASLALPLGYLRSRVQIPITNIGIEADGKYITYNGNTVYDIRAKVDYTLGFIPIVQPAVELGYRIEKFDLTSDDKKTKMNLDFSGVYAGLMVRF